jgi:hypothetical protein
LCHKDLERHTTMRGAFVNRLLSAGLLGSSYLLFFAPPCWSWTTYPTISFVSIRTVKHSNLNSALSAADAASFLDFSAPSEWEIFYQERPEVLEWHSSVPLERIASYVPNNKDHVVEILLIGCGNSRLPETILSSCKQNNVRIVLLDTSQTCLDQLEQLYGSAVEYVCGNAVALDRLFPNRQFDMVLDKGLSDALFCSEGWNGPMEDLYKGASKILRPDGGQYLLVSYKLPSSTKEFLEEVGNTVALEWEFDLKEDSNERVGVSLATKKMTEP